MSKIKRITAREILDSRGQPTLEVEVFLESGLSAAASVPSGASTGTLEAFELRDGDHSRYDGKGVLRAVRNVEEIIAPALKGLRVQNQRKIDQIMLELDGTRSKTRLGANAILGVSLAVCRLAAAAEKKPLYYYLAQLFGRKKEQLGIPIPMFNVINGGQHSDSGLSLQEFMLVPSGIKKFSEQLRAGSEIFQKLKQKLKKLNFTISVGDEGGFAPRLSSHFQALDLILEAIREGNYLPGLEVSLAVDAAANSFYKAEEDQYYLRPENTALRREALINFYKELLVEKFVISLEDGLQEKDEEGWTLMMNKIGTAVLKKGSNRTIKRQNMIVGDDLLVTNVKLLKNAVAKKLCNAAIVKLNQIGTLTETLDFLSYAQKAGVKTIVSHRSGETTDDFIADLAVGTGADFIKSGSLSRGERICKYNRLLKIAQEIEK